MAGLLLDWQVMPLPYRAIFTPPTNPIDPLEPTIRGRYKPLGLINSQTLSGNSTIGYI